MSISERDKVRWVLTYLHDAKEGLGLVGYLEPQELAEIKTNLLEIKKQIKMIEEEWY